MRKLVVGAALALLVSAGCAAEVYDDEASADGEGSVEPEYEIVDEAALSGNLVRNPGFEGGGSWDVFSTWILPSARRRGNVGARTWDGGGQSISARPGRRYTLSAYMRKARGTARAHAFMGWCWSESSCDTPKVIWATPQTYWQRIRIIRTAPSWAQYVRIGFGYDFGYEAPGYPSTDWDDFSLRYE